jgi:hypothetical protein
MYCMLDVSRFKDALIVKTLLARVVYDAFFYADLDRLATIETYT